MTPLAAGNPNLVVVGSINVDLTARVERLPVPGETVGGGELVRVVGGKGANQAAAAARLGARVRMVGAVGHDADGEWAREELRAAGVDVRAVTSVDAATGVALIGVDARGENQIIVCPGANARIGPAGVALAPDDVVITQLETPLDVVTALAAECPGFLVVNASPARRLPHALVERADLFVVNQEEYERMPELSRARRVAMTLGADGAVLLSHGSEIARAPGRRAEVVSTVGAGDAFCAALVIALARGASDAEALETACAVGAAAVEHEASQPPFRPLETYVAKASAT
ncbi:ribokinase [Microbacterium sp. BK668]|uniref:ribokinase n=1 Tax=Microbacterium sp. BK668 TaxID=2512118 RepID=UPI00105F76E6|nr:ribokinase [Microbacterium sp. BK668]TDN92633.1 ribokinase [Microbacterium sp. BK668]